MNPRIILVVLALVVAGCSTAAGSPPPPSPVPSEGPPSPTPVSQPTVAPSTPVPSQAPGSPAPTPTADPVVGLDVEPVSTIRVLVNGLAVRTGPGTGFPLLKAYGYNEVLITDALRLDDGHYLVVEHGPVIVNGIPWLQVHNIQQPGETADEMLRWNGDGDDFYLDSGWIAGAGTDGSAYVATDEVPVNPGDPVYGPAPDPYLVLTGDGSLTTDAFDVMAPPVIDWVAADPDGAACTVTITVQPGGEEIANEQVDQVAGEQVFSADVTGTVRLVIDSDCSWSMVVAPSQG